jgi:hypothetical protein
MKELLMLGALGIFVWLITSFMGPPTRRAPDERSGAAPHPETDVPMADTPVISDTGADY